MYTTQMWAAADRMLELADSAADDDLQRPTPCTGMDLSRLLAHVLGLAGAFAAAGRKDFGPLTDTPPDPAATELPDGWRTTMTGQLRELVASWEQPSAWAGMTRAGGIDAPAEILGTVALSELVLHGWAPSP